MVFGLPAGAVWATARFRRYYKLPRALFITPIGMLCLCTWSPLRLGATRRRQVEGTFMRQCDGEVLIYDDREMSCDDLLRNATLEECARNFHDALDRHISVALELAHWRPPTGSICCCRFCKTGDGACPDFDVRAHSIASAMFANLLLLREEARTLHLRLAMRKSECL